MERHIILPERLLRSCSGDAARAYGLLSLGCSPTFEALAEALDCSDRTARRVVQNLCEQGWIELVDARKLSRVEARKGGDFVPICQICHGTQSGFDAICQICHGIEKQSVFASPGYPIELSDWSSDWTIERLIDRTMGSQENPEFFCRVKRDDRFSSVQEPLFVPPEVPAAAPTEQEALEASAHRVLAAFNHATGRHFRPSELSLGNVRQRIRDGATEAELLLVIEHRVHEWQDDESMAQYLRPTTIFSQEKYQAYAMAALAWSRKGKKSPQRRETEMDRRAAMRAHDRQQTGQPGPQEAETPAVLVGRARVEFFRAMGRAWTKEEELEVKRKHGMVCDDGA